MQFDWRAISGPALAAATALIAILVDRFLTGVPNPAPLLVCIVAFAGSLSRCKVSSQPSYSAKDITTTDLPSRRVCVVILGGVSRTDRHGSAHTWTWI